MAAIKYEVAKELYDEGFPQAGAGAWALPSDKLVSRRTDRVYVPTLSELVDACGDNFKCLRNIRREMWAAHGRIEGDKLFEETWPHRQDYVAEAVTTYTADDGATGPIFADGSTPTEAVARLWLALNKRL